MNLREQKKKLDWLDHDKVDEMSFDCSEWSETSKILDDPDVSQEVKQKAWEDYKVSLFKRMGVKGY